ncbi:MAG: S-layer homology domain-containing protein, partial [Firmicutes bacterium]|nr:S-layer homology domain-containing protein [Bacillota bacterium]
ATWDDAMAADVIVDLPTVMPSTVVRATAVWGNDRGEIGVPNERIPEVDLDRDGDNNWVVTLPGEEDPLDIDVDTNEDGDYVITITPPEGGYFDDDTIVNLIPDDYEIVEGPTLNDDGTITVVVRPIPQQPDRIPEVDLDRDGDNNWVVTLPGEDDPLDIDVDTNEDGDYVITITPPEGGYFDDDTVVNLIPDEYEIVDGPTLNDDGTITVVVRPHERFYLVRHVLQFPSGIRTTPEITDRIPARLRLELEALFASEQQPHVPPVDEVIDAEYPSDDEDDATDTEYPSDDEDDATDTEHPSDDEDNATDTEYPSDDEDNATDTEYPSDDEDNATDTEYPSDDEDNATDTEYPSDDEDNATDTEYFAALSASSRLFLGSAISAILGFEVEWPEIAPMMSAELQAWITALLAHEDVVASRNYILNKFAPYGVEWPFTCDDSPIKTEVDGNILYKVYVLQRCPEYRFVYFDLNNGTGIAPEDRIQRVPVGGTATRPTTNPTRAGFDFAGWECPQTGELFDFSTPIYEDRILRARWTIRYTPQPPPQPPTPPQPPVPPQPPTPQPPTEPDGIPWTPRQPTVLLPGYPTDEPTEEPTEYPTDEPTEDPPTFEPALTHYAFIIGFSDGTVRPHANMTRAEAATIFFRLISDQHRARIWSQTNSFADVTPERWFNNPISSMERGGLFRGIPLGSYFNPNQAITRAEFAAMVVNFLGLGNATFTGNNAFTDINGHWASNVINLAYQQSWIRGFGDGTFRPDQAITRAEVVALVNRALNRVPEFPSDLLDGMVRFVDNANPNAWYFLYIQEAANSHYHVMKADGIHETWTQLITPRNWRALERPYSQPHHIH